jgi:hypothetical protein
MTSVVGIVKQSILKGNHGDDLQLELFPELIPTKDFEKVIFFLCKACIQAKNGKALKDILQYFNQERASLDPLPTLTFLAFNPYINDSLLKDISLFFPEKKFIDYMNDVISMLHNIEIALPVAKRWESVLPPASIEEWKKIKEISESIYEDNEDSIFTDKLLYHWIIEKYNNIKTTVAPSWIRFKENVPSIVEIIQTNPYPLKNRYPKTVDAVPIILENLTKCAISYDSLPRKTIGTLYNISSSREKYALLYPNQDNTIFFDDIDYFTCCGPTNGNTYTAYQENQWCYYTGECRMLSCNCHERKEEEEEDERFQDFYDMECNSWVESDDICIEEPKEKPLYAWFTNSCNVCKVSICRAEYALRRPLPEGGWSNECYCGEECLAKVMNFEENPDDILLYAKLLEQLDKKGIYISS